MSETAQIKRLLEEVGQLFDSIEGAVGKPEGLEISLREVFKIDVLSMILYFSASDGTLSVKEKDMINEIFDFEGSVQDYATYIQEKNIYSTSFENRDLLSLTIMAAFEEAAKEAIEKPALPQVIELMMAIAKSVILSDDNATDQEKEDFAIYFSNIHDKYLGDKDVPLNKKTE